MVRNARARLPGPLQHLTSRGQARRAIFIDDIDRRRLLLEIGRAFDAHEVRLLAYCLMGNHYHLVVDSAGGDLSAFVSHVNGRHAQAFNHRHGGSGHVFEGRFHAQPIETDAHLAASCRYVEMNPVRAGLVRAPEDWPWSSHRALMGWAEAPRWLDTERVLRLGTAVDDPRDLGALRARWARGFDIEPAGNASTMPAPVGQDALASTRSVQEWLALGPTREAAMRRARFEGGFTLARIAEATGLSVSQVSRLTRAGGR